jgi:hypothetical protein
MEKMTVQHIYKITYFLIPHYLGDLKQLKHTIRINICWHGNWQLMTRLCEGLIVQELVHELAFNVPLMLVLLQE